MKRALTLLTMITSAWAYAGFEVTDQSAGLGETQSVTLNTAQHSTLVVRRWQKVKILFLL